METTVFFIPNGRVWHVNRDENLKRISVLLCLSQLYHGPERGTEASTFEPQPPKFQNVEQQNHYQPHHPVFHESLFMR